MFRTKKAALFLITSLLLAVVLASCTGAAPSPAASNSPGASSAPRAETAKVTDAKDMTYEKAMQGWDQIIAAAKKEGKLVMNVAISDTLVKALADAWKVDYPEISLEINRGTPSGMYEKEKAEVSAGIQNLDLTLGGLTTGTLGVKEGLSQPFFAPEAFNPKTKWSPVNPYDSVAGRTDGQLTIFTYYFFGIIINTKMVPPADEPKSWKDMADPKWKGKVIMNNPAIPGPGDNWYYIVRNQPGGLDLMKALGAQKFAIAATSTDGPEMVGRGEYAALFPASTFHAWPPKDKGMPVKFITPKEGVITSLHAARITPNAPHVNAAKLMINWLLTDKAQKLLGPAGGFGPILAGTAGDPIFNIEGFPVTKMTADDFGKIPTMYPESKEIFGIR